MYHMIGLNETRSIKNVTLKAAKKFVGVVVYWEEYYVIIWRGWNLPLEAASFQAGQLFCMGNAEQGPITTSVNTKAILGWNQIWIILVCGR